MKKIISLIAVILCTIFALTACGNGKGFEMGFSRGTELPQYWCAVKSDKTDFNIDEVKLDFYFGWPDNGGGYAEVSNPVYEFICFAVYFYGVPASTSQGPYDDFRNIESHYLIKEFSKEEFLSDEYKVKVKNGFLSAKATFNHHETLTVPKELYANTSSGSFSFKVEVVYRIGEKYELLGGYNDVKISYKYIDDQTIRLS